MSKPILWVVGLEPTNNCNFKCPMCWSQNPKLHPPRPRGFMSWRLFTKVIDELAEYSQESKRMVALCMNYGGESMLHPRYEDMIRYANSKNRFCLRAITNASLLTPEICKTLIDCNVSVTVSIHNTLQLSEVYHKVSMLVAARQGKTKPFLDGSIIVCEFDKKELMRQLAWWTKIMDEVRVYPLMTEELTYVNYPNRAECKQPLNYMGILWNGDVYPCCHLLSTSFKGMGNIAETSVTEVWNGERYRLLRQGQLPDAPCGNCEFW